MVYVKLYSTLTKFLKGVTVGETMQVEVPPGATVKDLIAKLGIGPGEVFLISVNSQVEDHAYCLNHGDEVSLFGPMAGGAGAIAGNMISSACASTVCPVVVEPLRDTPVA